MLKEEVNSLKSLKAYCLKAELVQQQRAVMEETLRAMDALSQIAQQAPNPLLATKAANSLLRKIDKD